MSDMELQILKNLVHSDEYARIAAPYLKDEYFTTHANKVLYKEITKYFEQYNKCPSVSALNIIVDKIDLNEDSYKEIQSRLEYFKEKELPDIEWLIHESEKFCQDRAIYNAIMDSIKILDSDSKQDKGAIPALLQNALSVCFDPSIGHDFIEDANERFEFYQEKLERVPFDIDYLNKITNGGLPKKSLSCIMAACVHPNTKIRIRYRRKSESI